MRKLNHALLASALALACASCTAEKEANYQVIPLPQEVSLTQGNPFKLNENVLIAYPENNALLQRMLSSCRSTSNKPRTTHRKQRPSRQENK